MTIAAPPGSQIAKAKIILPNVRKMFIPDPGYRVFDADLKGADAQVVAWEANDEELKAAFRAGLDVHAKNAEDMWGSEFTRLQGHARYSKRQQNKVAVHLTNYGGKARTLAVTQRWTVHEAERWQRRWFSLHPGILDWHRRVEDSLRTTRTVSNAFGYRIIYFDRIDSVFGQALAWGPQSTVGIVAFRGYCQICDRHPEVEPLLQNHDSDVFQIPLRVPLAHDFNAIRSALAITVPYSDPLVIPWDLSYSDASWGDVQKVKEITVS